MSDSISMSGDDRCVQFTPAETIKHQFAKWTGLKADVITAVQREPLTYRFKSKQHLLIAAEHVEREDGETAIEGLPRSKLRSLSGKLTFVPAGYEFSGWQQPLVPARVVTFYIDPQNLLLDEQLRFGEIEFQPRLFFSDAELWRIAMKLKDEALKGENALRHYGEALAVLLAHELVRLNNGGEAAAPLARGGLAGWQQKRVADFIESHLASNVPLAELAALVDYSPFHFARAFKRSFGLPPHRYHVSRRIERAKELLAVPGNSVTSVGLAVGFAETSSFSAAFRKITGRAPSDYRREVNAGSVLMLPGHPAVPSGAAGVHEPPQSLNN